jgi:hypothetical protein
MKPATRFSLVISAAILSAAPWLEAQAQQQAPQAPQAPNMTFFVTGAGPGKGADLGGIEGADRYCQELAQRAGAGGKTWRAYLSTPDRRRQAGRQCARSRRARPLAELQG